MRASCSSIFSIRNGAATHPTCSPSAGSAPSRSSFAAASRFLWERLISDSCFPSKWKAGWRISKRRMWREIHEVFKPASRQCRTDGRSHTLFAIYCVFEGRLSLAREHFEKSSGSLRSMIFGPEQLRVGPAKPRGSRRNDVGWPMRTRRNIVSRVGRGKERPCFRRTPCSTISATRSSPSRATSATSTTCSLCSATSLSLWLLWTAVWLFAVNWKHLWSMLGRGGWAGRSQRCSASWLPSPGRGSIRPRAKSATSTPFGGSSARSACSSPSPSSADISPGCTLLARSRPEMSFDPPAPAHDHGHGHGHAHH